MISYLLSNSAVSTRDRGPVSLLRNATLVIQPLKSWLHFWLINVRASGYKMSKQSSKGKDYNAESRMIKVLSAKSVRHHVNISGPCDRLVISAIVLAAQKPNFSAALNLFSLSKSTQGQPRPPPRILNSGVLPALLGV